jgi:hypothetical protein
VRISALRELVALRFVFVAELAPELRPVITIEARERADDALGIFLLHRFEGTDAAPCAPQHFLLDVFKRGARFARVLDDCHDKSSA